MLKNTVELEEKAAAPAITANGMSRDEMKQAIFQRFGRETDAGTATAARKRSPYWQPVDEEC